MNQYSNVTYIQIVYDIRPKKKETHRVRLTVGGNKLTYNKAVSTHTSYLTTAKLHCNIILFTPDRKWTIVDFNNFYLNNPIKKAEYYKLVIKLIPEVIIDKYDLNTKQSGGYI